MIVLKKEWSYTLEKDQEENYFLSVVAGGVAVFEINIKLSSEEISQFETHGEFFINNLVKDIQESPSKWSARNIPS